MTRDAPPMFSNLFSDALFTKQRKRIRCCAAAWRNGQLKSLKNSRRPIRPVACQPACLTIFVLTMTGRIAGAGGSNSQMSAK